VFQFSGGVEKGGLNEAVDLIVVTLERERGTQEL
jgi:hypothetical protein